MRSRVSQRHEVGRAQAAARCPVVGAGVRARGHGVAASRAAVRRPRRARRRRRVAPGAARVPCVVLRQLARCCSSAGSPTRSGHANKLLTFTLPAEFRCRCYATGRCGRPEFSGRDAKTPGFARSSLTAPQRAATSRSRPSGVHACGANPKKIFAGGALSPPDRARPTKGSDRGFARSIPIRWASPPSRQ
jgi:hypothetical protein